MRSIAIAPTPCGIRDDSSWPKPGTEMSRKKKMIEPVEAPDIPEIQRLIESAIRESVADSDEDAVYLIDDIQVSIDWWQENPGKCLHLKCVDDGEVVGVILVKDYWNLVNLFVSPAMHRQGIGRNLFFAVEPLCREQSPRGRIQVNSSANAVGFYKAIGFHQTGPGRNRPGGCVPLEYVF